MTVAPCLLYMTEKALHLRDETQSDESAGIVTPSWKLSLWIIYGVQFVAIQCDKHFYISCGMALCMTVGSEELNLIYFSNLVHGSNQKGSAAVCDSLAAPLCRVCMLLEP